MRKQEQVLNRLKLALLLVVTVYSVSAIGQPFKVLSPPDPNSIPLLVLEAKQKEFLGNDTVDIVKAPSGDMSAMKAIMNSKSVDVALFNFLSGGKFYSQGISHLKLAGVHVWGGVGILSKTEIKPNDWSALKGTKGISIPGIKTPPHIFAMSAMRKNGLNPKKDVKVAGMGPAIAFTTMSQKDKSPLFALAPEPLISIVLFKQEKEGWEQKYHLFADSSTAITGKSGKTPLGAFWIVNDKTEHVDKLIYGFEKAISFINNPENKEEVAKIVAAGFKKHFGQKVPPKVFESMLERGVLKLQFKDSKFIKKTVNKFWKGKKIDVDDKIFYSRATNYKVPRRTFFTSQLMARLVGGTLSNKDNIQFSKEAIKIAKNIRKRVKKRFGTKPEQIAKLEKKLFDLSLKKGTKDEITGLIKQISKLKEELSLIQLDCIESVKKEFPEEDLNKVIEFYEKNKEYVFMHQKI